MTAQVYDKPDRNYVTIKLPKTLCEVLGSDVVVTQKKGVIRVRQAMLMDNKTLKINDKTRTICYTSFNCKDFVGEYAIEQDGDYFNLIKPEPDGNNV